MVSPGGCSRSLWKNCWLKGWGLGIGHLGAAGSCVGSSEEGWALFKESQLLGYSPSFSLIRGVEVWVEIPGFWLFSIRNVWWAEKQFGSGYKALIFCLFLISERLGKALGLEHLLHLCDLPGFQLEVATPLQWKWKKNSLFLHIPTLVLSFGHGLKIHWIEQ